MILTPVYIGPRRYDHLIGVVHQCGVTLTEEEGGVTMTDLIKGDVRPGVRRQKLSFCRLHGSVYLRTEDASNYIWTKSGIWYSSRSFVFKGGPCATSVQQVPQGNIIEHPLTNEQLYIDFPRPPQLILYRDLGGGLFQSETCEGEYVLWDVFQIEKQAVYLLRLPALVTHHILSFLVIK
jgi:hypothetical protein